MAAVVPVILLVAVVEVHQITRRSGERSAALATAYQDAAARLNARDSATSAQSLQEINSDVNRLAHALVGSFAGLNRILYCVWAFTGVLLLLSLSTSLYWLADDARSPDTFSATFHLVALNWGALVVLNTPLATWIAQSRQELAAAETYRDAMIQAVSEAEGAGPVNG
ncbi:hypothetical protein [Streptomyces sp. DSM 118878]